MHQIGLVYRLSLESTLFCATNGSLLKMDTIAWWIPAVSIPPKRPGRRGWGVLPIMTFTPRLSRMRCLVRLQVYEIVGKSVFSLCKKRRKVYRSQWQSRENVVVLWFTHILNTLHLRQLKGMPSCKLGTICQYEVWYGGTFSVKKRYIKG